jgi:hypothetical protein
MVPEVGASGLLALLVFIGLIVLIIAAGVRLGRRKR